MVSEIRRLDEEELIDMFFGNLPDTKSLNLTLDRIMENIEQVKKIPKKREIMNFNPKFGKDKFMNITIDSFIKLFKQKNPDINRADLKKNLTHFKTTISEGEK